MNLRTTLSTRLSTRPSTAGRSPRPYRRPAVLLAVAASGALAANVLSAGEPAAHASADRPVSVAAQLGLTGKSSVAPTATSLRTLQELTASRSQRQTEAAAAQQAQNFADQAKLAALAAAARAQQEAQQQAAAQQAAAQQAAAQQAAAQQQAATQAAAQQAAAQQAAAQQAAAQQAAARPAASFPEYALTKLRGDQQQFSCLQDLWGKESGWNPNAQNRGSTAYGIAQFLDSTWASTGIAKTSDGYRQIDAGLIYIDRTYGSPCAAWAHSRADNWY